MATDQDAAGRSSHRLTRKRLLIAIVLVVAGCVAFGLVRIAQSAFAARAGRADLERAASALRAQRVDDARSAFLAADRHFRAAHNDLHDLGPLLPVSKVIPLVRVQIRGLETMSDVGTLLSNAGGNLTDAASAVLEARDAHKPLSQSLDKLDAVQVATDNAVSVLSQARERTATLDGYRLFGPLGSTRSKLEVELRQAEERASSADAGMRLLLWAVGADRPTRLLVFSQNPDEVRPTGGFLGTYGVMTGNGGHVRLPTYGDINHWVPAHPGVGIPPAKAPNAFQFSTPPAAQGLANVNATPDWPTSADLAMKLWARAGEQPVDGVVSLMPADLVRLVRVLGPVKMPAYGETITPDNLVARLNYHTHREAVRGDPNRKQFVADLAQLVLKRVIAAPSSRWLDLGQAMAAGFDAGEALLWSSVPSMQRVLNGVGWSGRFPSTTGDFYADAEFEYLAKNGSALKRTFTHEVTLRSDGSGVASTTMVLRDTAPAEVGYNDDSLSYITPYGPRFATLDPSSDRPDTAEATLSGHPSAGYLRAAQPLGSMTLHVAWRCQRLAIPRTDGSLLYTLEFRGQPGHLGDVLHLTVHPPPGWQWVVPPPKTVRIDGVFRGSWVLHHS